MVTRYGRLAYKKRRVFVFLLVAKKKRKKVSVLKLLLLANKQVIIKIRGSASKGGVFLVKN